MSVVILATLLGACAAPASAPAASPSKAPESSFQAAAGNAPSEDLLGLADLPRGWMVTRETINDAAEYAGDSAEQARLRDSGFLWNWQRDLENRYGGGPRWVGLSVSRYGDGSGASLSVSDRTKYTIERAAVWDHSVRTLDLPIVGADEVKMLVVDRSNQERLYVAYFRVGTAAAGVLVGGYPDTLELDFVLKVMNEQARRLDRSRSGR